MMLVTPECSHARAHLETPDLEPPKGCRSNNFRGSEHRLRRERRCGGRFRSRGIPVDFVSGDNRHRCADSGRDLERDFRAGAVSAAEGRVVAASWRLESDAHTRIWVDQCTAVTRRGTLRRGAGWLRSRAEVGRHPQSCGLERLAASRQGRAMASLANGLSDLLLQIARHNVQLFRSSTSRSSSA